MTVSANAYSIPSTKEESVRRFDFHQIIQHAGLMVSFIILVLTGLPLKFSEAAISKWWIALWGGVEVTRSAHYVGAWVMIAACVYHIIYLIITVAIMRRPFPVKMIPSTKDITKLYQEILYFLGFTKVRPAFDRYNWREKFDYWAMFWGIPVMVLSGLILMFPVVVTKFMPGWILPVALIAHSDEAMLALGWIVLVHVFFNHFTPGLFPLNKSIFTGKIPLKRYRIDHAEDYREMVAKGEIHETGSIDDSGLDPEE